MAQARVQAIQVMSTPVYPPIYASPGPYGTVPIDPIGAYQRGRIMAGY